MAAEPLGSPPGPIAPKPLQKIVPVPPRVMSPDRMRSPGRRAADIVSALVESVRGMEIASPCNRPCEEESLLFLPNRSKTEHLLSIVRKIMFPGLFTDFQISDENLGFHLGMLLSELKDLLVDQISRALAYQCKPGLPRAKDVVHAEALEKTEAFLSSLESLRGMLLKDVESAMRGDPAARSHEEIILCYPGIEAVFVHRVAHELFKLQIPIIPRMMSAFAHQKTAIDIHPGAEIGSHFFIDHGTGVVIGETTKIGNNVKLFHGVTLGA
eukprot:RCo000682